MTQSGLTRISEPNTKIISSIKERERKYQWAVGVARNHLPLRNLGLDETAEALRIIPRR